MSDATSPVIDVKVASSLEADWVPEGVAVHVFAKRDDQLGPWEAIVAEFGIAGMGEGPEAAVVNALELLDDYLVLCQEEGKSFDECFRPSGRRTRIAVARDAMRLLLAGRPSRPSAPLERAEYTIPLRLVGSH